MKKIFYSILIGAATVFALSACSETEPETGSKDIKGLSFANPTVELFVGETVDMGLVITPSGANTSQLICESDDPETATTDGRYVTGVKAGTAKIKVSASKDGGETISTSAELNVAVKNHPVTGVTLSATTLELFKNKTAELTATVEPANATIKDVVFTTSDPTVLVFISGEEEVNTVTGTSATVKAKAPGTATVTAASVDDASKTAVCNVTALNVDDIDMWASDEAGSIAIIGGDQEDIEATAENFLSYSKSTGKVSWTANTTGQIRTAELSLSSGSKIKVTQIGPAIFKGKWDFRTQRFSNNAAVCAAAADVTIELTIGDAKFGETLTDHDGTTYTNNLGVTGLYLDAVADAVAVIDYENKTVKFGLFLDERKAQSVPGNGNATYPYVCFIPECGTTWNSTTMANPWNFVPKPISTTQNYQWLWFDVKEDLKTMQYDHPYQQPLIGKDGSNGTTIIGITCAVAKNANPTADDIYGTYNVIYQANPGKKNNVGGFMLTKKN